MVSGVDLDPSVFPFQDVRYKGTRGGNTGTVPKLKKVKLATNFVKPVVPVQSSPSVSNNGGVGDEKGEKDKPKRRATPSPSPVRDGAVGGEVKGDSSGGPHNTNSTVNSVAKFKAPISNKGEWSVLV